MLDYDTVPVPTRVRPYMTTSPSSPVIRYDWAALTPRLAYATHGGPHVRLHPARALILRDANHAHQSTEHIRNVPVVRTGMRNATPATKERRLYAAVPRGCGGCTRAPHVHASQRRNQRKCNGGGCRVTHFSAPGLSTTTMNRADSIANLEPDQRRVTGVRDRTRGKVHRLVRRRSLSHQVAQLCGQILRVYWDARSTRLDRASSGARASRRGRCRCARAARCLHARAQAELRGQRRPLHRPCLHQRVVSV